MPDAMPEMLITTYLQMTRRDQFRPAYAGIDGVQIIPMQMPDVEFYRFLYSGVGGVWRWRDRLIMPVEELQAALAAPGTSVHVLYLRGVPAGYVELVRRAAETEIAYFGLRPAYTGIGLGKHLLSTGITQAWEADIQRVWLHTCNLDSPHALDNYRKRGFEVYDVQQQPMPTRYQ